MKLYIDTSDRNKIIIGINDKKYEEKAYEMSSQKLLPFIEEVLKKENLTPKDITNVEVNTGPGSFTGLRVGVAVANTVGFVLGVPVNNLKTETKIKY